MPRAARRAAAPPGASASRPAPAGELQRVEITGSRPSDTEERRRSTASKIVIGRDEIERFGDASVNDVLKRLPGVTIQGRPGRGGAIRMRGLGNGYTQILLDGQRVPPGFSLDSLTPEQIERIEVLRAPTAETGARAIAGTINIVTREGHARRSDDVRLTAALENGRLQPSVSWTKNEPLGPFVVNLSATAYALNRRTDSTTTTEDVDDASGATTLFQREAFRGVEKRHGVNLSGRLQWRAPEGTDTLILMPLIVAGTGTATRSSALAQSVGSTPAPYDTSATTGDGSSALVRLNGTWNHRLAAGGRVETRLGAGQARTIAKSFRTETLGGALAHTLDDRSDSTDRTLIGSAKLVRLFGGEGDHSLVAGVEGETNRRDDTRTTLQDGLPVLVDFGDLVSAKATRVAGYAQDEWNLDPQWAAHAGLRWEAITTRGTGAAGEAGAGSTNRSSVWTPLLHAVWKPEPEAHDQLRFSLTRSYRSPALASLIARPSLNRRYPLPGPNTPTQPDSGGNPALRPELASGVDVAFEHYLPASGLVSVNLFARRLKDYMRRVTELEQVNYAPVARYVSRPRNLGGATTAGLELEAKFRLADLWPDAPRVDVRSNASLFRSRVDGVPGPNNRLDQQPSATANLGADWRAPGWPLTFGGNLNWTPGYATRLSDEQSASTGAKVVVDGYALWSFGPGAALRLTVSNAVPRDYLTGATYDDGGVRESSRTVAPTYLNVQARLELRL